MRLLTWNIRGCLGMDNRRSVERVADVIRECRADVVCLQEVHERLAQSRLQDQPRLLAELLDMKGYFLASYRIGVGGFGNMILTHHPVRSHERHPLPNQWERRSLIFLLERRAVVSAEVDAPLGRIRVMTAHFSLNRFDRMKSVERVKQLMEGAGCPVIFCGDLNARPTSEEMRFLAAQCGLVDAGSTGNAPTYPAGHTRARIDYVWHSQGLRCAEPEIVDSHASDHLPVVTDISPMRA